MTDERCARLRRMGLCRRRDRTAHSGRRLPTPPSPTPACGGAYPSCSRHSRRISIVLFHRYHRQIARAILFASAIATNMSGLRRSIRASHDPSTIYYGLTRSGVTWRR